MAKAPTLVAVGKTLMVSGDGGQSWRETVVRNGASDNVMGGYNNFRAMAARPGKSFATRSTERKRRF